MVVELKYKLHQINLNNKLKIYLTNVNRINFKKMYYIIIVHQFNEFMYYSRHIQIF